MKVSVGTKKVELDNPCYGCICNDCEICCLNCEVSPERDCLKDECGNLIAK